MNDLPHVNDLLDVENNVMTREDEGIFCATPEYIQLCMKMQIIVSGIISRKKRFDLTLAITSTIDLICPVVRTSLKINEGPICRVWGNWLENRLLHSYLMQNDETIFSFT